MRRTLMQIWLTVIVVLSSVACAQPALITVIVTARSDPMAEFLTDQGAQFTAHAFTGALGAAGIRISMDGRGRAFDNMFVERL